MLRVATKLGLNTLLEDISFITGFTDETRHCINAVELRLLLTLPGKKFLSSLVTLYPYSHLYGYDSSDVSALAASQSSLWSGTEFAPVGSVSTTHAYVGCQMEVSCFARLLLLLLLW